MLDLHPGWIYAYCPQGNLSCVKAGFKQIQYAVKHPLQNHSRAASTAEDEKQRSGYGIAARVNDLRTVC